MPSDPEGSVNKRPRRGRPDLSRAALANAVEEQAGHLRQTYTQLRHEWVDPDNPRVKIIDDLETVKDCIDKLTGIIEQCENAHWADATLRGPIQQLFEELDTSKAITQAAFLSLRAKDQDSQFLTQAKLHSESVSQLKKLSSRCRGLVTKLRGTHHRP